MALRRPAEVFPPGDFLQEELEERGWTQTDLAAILDRPPRLVNEIIAGKRAITPETARGLAAAFGSSPEYWMNLESSYQLWRAGDDQGDAVARRARLYELAPIGDLERRGWIEKTPTLDVLQQQVLDFLEMDSLDDEPPLLPHAARKSTSYTSEWTAAERAWLFRSRHLARAMESVRFTQSGFDRALVRLRALGHGPGAVSQVPAILAEAGIRFLIIQALPGTRVDGACFWIDDAPVIVLSIRFDRIDNFWFVLFHELGHIAGGDGKEHPTLDRDLEKADASGGRPPSEHEADDFATRRLIPEDPLKAFMREVRPFYSRARIESFAQLIQVHPGVVVGQLHHLGEVPYANLRKLLVPVREMVTATALTDGWGAVPSARMAG
jgi:HTH-type transcriptional regulator / antitoxin HigA